MNFRVRQINFLFLVMFLLSSAAAGVRASAISVSQSVSASEIAFEDSVVFEITLKWEGNQSAYRFQRPIDPQFGKMKVEGFSSSVSSHLPVGSDSTETTTRRYRYLLKPVLSGSTRVEPLTITYIALPDSSVGELKTEPITIDIATPRPPEESSGGSWLWWIVSSVTLITIAGTIVFFRKSRSNEVSTDVSPAQTALRQLAELNKEVTGDFKKFQFGLHHILLRFLCERYGLSFESMDRAELERAIESIDLVETHKKQIIDLLVRAEQDKFRPAQAAPGETARLEAEVKAMFGKL